GPSVLRLNDDRPDSHVGQGRQVEPLMRSRHHDQGAVRSDTQHDAAAGRVEKGPITENGAELLGAVVAGQRPGEGAKTGPLSTGQHDRPTMRRHQPVHSTTTTPFIPSSRWSRPACVMSHSMSNVPRASGVNLISALLPGRSFTYLIPFGASTSISPPSTSRSREARYGDVNMCVIRPRLTSWRVTGLPTARITRAGVNAYSLSTMRT